MKGDDVIAESAMPDLQRKRRVVVGPAPDRMVSYDKTVQCTVTEDMVSFSGVVGLVGLPVDLLLRHV